MIARLKKGVKISPKCVLNKVIEDKIQGGFKVIVPIGHTEAVMYISNDALIELRKML